MHFSRFSSVASLMRFTLLNVNKSLFLVSSPIPLISSMVEAVCFLLLLPLTQIANRYFPYINGNPIKEETRLIKYGKYLSTAAAGAVPYLYFNNHFMDGMLRESLTTQLLSAAVYIVAVVIAVNIANKYMPIIFVQDRKRNKN